MSSRIQRQVVKKLLIPSGYDIHSSPWKDPPFLYKFGKPSISIRAIDF